MSKTGQWTFRSRSFKKKFIFNDSFLNENFQLSITSVYRTDEENIYSTFKMYRMFVLHKIVL